VKAGLLTLHFKKYSSDRELAELEVKAPESRLGIWSMPNPAHPWADASRARTASGESTAAAPQHGNVRSRALHRSVCEEYNCRICRAVLDSREKAVAAWYRTCCKVQAVMGQDAHDDPMAHIRSRIRDREGIRSGRSPEAIVVLDGIERIAKTPGFHIRSLDLHGPLPEIVVLDTRPPPGEPRRNLQ